jgi:hypothetical protein
MYRYSDTLGFDLAVVVFVVGVMPLAVFLMQSKRRLARATALALMFAAVMYVAVFEHYRLHRPEVTELGLKRAVVPESVLDFVEARLEERQRASRERRFLENQLVFAEIATLPVAADEDILRAACAEMAASPTRKVEPEPAVFPFGRSVPRKAGTSGKKETQKKKRPVDAGPLMVHLSHRGAGDRFFADALSALERETCGDARDETGGGDIPENEEEEDIPENADDEFAAARAPASPPEVSFENVSAFALRRSRPRCAPRRVVASEPGNGSPGALSFETLFDESSAVGDRNVFVTFESPARADASLGNLLRAAETAGVTYSYRAVFFVRDPRDVVTQAYLDRIARRSTLDVEHRSDFDSDFDGPGGFRPIDGESIARSTRSPPRSRAGRTTNASRVSRLGRVSGTNVLVFSGRSSTPPRRGTTLTLLFRAKKKKTTRKKTKIQRSLSRRACARSRRSRTRTKTFRCVSCGSRICSSRRARASNFSGGGSACATAPTSTRSPTPASTRRRASPKQTKKHADPNPNPGDPCPPARGAATSRRATPRGSTGRTARCCARSGTRRPGRTRAISARRARRWRRWKRVVSNASYGMTISLAATSHGLTYE